MIFFATCPPGAEEALAGELKHIGAGSVRPKSRGVFFEGDLGHSYRACLDLRTASRILLELRSGEASDEDALYRLVNDHPWEEEFSSSLSISCRVNGVPSDRDPRFATLRVKDGIVDRFNDKEGQRPYVDRRNPDVRIEARWDGHHATVYLNWSGAPLHERGYRLERTDAVLRETTAAAVLMMAGWPEKAKEGAAFVDPVCGSGTLLAEAAMMAIDAPAGARRKEWGFEGLKRHGEEVWRELRNEANIRFGEGLEKMPRILGCDIDQFALKTARNNLRRAGLHNLIRLEHHDIISGKPDYWPVGESGLLCADPPYGVRTTADPTPVYESLGRVFRSLESGWTMALLAPDRKTVSASCLRAKAYHHTVSGGMDLTLALYERHGGADRNSRPGGERPAAGTPRTDGSGRDRSTDIREKPRDTADQERSAAPERPAPDPKAPSLKKALERNMKALETWAGKAGVSSYRIWDADMPEFNAAVDWYEGRWLLVQEFAAPGKVPPEKIRRRLLTLLDVLKEATGCPDENLYLKTRQRGIRPYGKMGAEKDRFIVRENGLKFFVNLSDYLDSGIFLDHRNTRALIAEKAKGGRFLNLFAYTGTASVMAASGGAKRTVSVDVSNTYLNWARDNMKLNNLDTRSQTFLRSDAFAFLHGSDEVFDLIFVDPPTYSNGTGRDDWSVQDHHGALLRLAMKKLAPGGTVLFSENFRRFELDAALRKEFSVREITRETIPPDFARRGRAHRCWEFSFRD